MRRARAGTKRKREVPRSRSPSRKKWKLQEEIQTWITTKTRKAIPKKNGFLRSKGAPSTGLFAPELTKRRRKIKRNFKSTIDKG